MTRSRALRAALMIPAAAAALAAPALALADDGYQVGGPDPTIRLVEKPVRTLQPFADEFVPASTCPDTHPYLVDERFDGNPASALRGIIVRRSSANLDVSITGPQGIEHPFRAGSQLLHGIKAGFPNSSAMNWDFVPNTYQIVMKCTSNPSLGLDVTDTAGIIG